MKNIYATLLLILGLCAVHPVSVEAADSSKASFTVKVTGKGPPVILIPGLSCSGAVWDGTVAHLKDHYECHVVTLAGFGGQAPVENFSLETVRNDLAAYIRGHKLEHPVIIGHSLGGFLALWLAAQEPELPGKLVIVDSLPFLPLAFNPAATAEAMKPIAEKMRADMLADKTQFVANSQGMVKSMVTRPADVDLVMSWVKATDPAAAANGMYDMFTHDLRADLARIKAPTLELGTWIAFKDYSSRAETEARIHEQYKQLKNCKIVMAETRHFIMLDDPEWFYQQVDGFLEEKK